MNEQYLSTLVAFSLTDLIGFNRFIKIKKQFPNISDFLELSIDDQLNFLTLTNDRAHHIFSTLPQQRDRVLEICTKQNIQLLPHTSPNYPSQLKAISDPPYLLYCQGDFQSHIPLIGVIGTRNTSSDAEKCNRWFCEEFVRFGFGTVSGLAAGHDAIAADSTLQNQGYSVAVLGTAIGSIYPKSSTRLYHKLIEQGAILSEYPPGMTSTKWRFPRRNRIVSGLSQAILVVQAPEKSGTLITVSMASSQNKEVYVIPGNPLDPKNHGSNSLIQHGTKLALKPQDMIQELLKNNPNMEIARFVSKTPEPIPQTIEFASSEEEQVYNLLGEEQHIDSIARELEINISILNSMLTMMEIKGLIQQKPGQIYARGNA